MPEIPAPYILDDATYTNFAGDERIPPLTRMVSNHLWFEIIKRDWLLANVCKGISVVYGCVLTLTGDTVSVSAGVVKTVDRFLTVNAVTGLDVSDPGWHLLFIDN